MDTKVCTKCGEVKALSEFYKDNRRKNGLQPKCKDCEKAYKAENADKVAAYHKTYRNENADKIKNYKKTYQAENAEKLAAWHKVHYAENTEKRAAQTKANGKSLAKFDVYASQLDFAETCTEGPNGELLIPCTYCGKLHAPTAWEARRRIGALSGKVRGECRLYCSQSCKCACPSYRKQTKWASNKPATSREVSAQFRQLVLKRDDYTCQKCGKGTEAQLHVHHIEGATQQPGMSNDIENGITLCKKCHKAVHLQDGCKYHELKCPAK